MQAKNLLSIAVTCLAIMIPLAMVFTHLNFSFHRRSWEKSRIDAQREAAHEQPEKSALLYDFALQDAERFPITPLMHATTYREAADILAGLKKYDKARDYYDKCLGLMQKEKDVDSKEWLAEKFACLSGLGRVAFAQNDLDRSEILLQSALPIYSRLLEIGQKHSTQDLVAADAQVHGLIDLASIYSIRAQDAKAIPYVVEAQKLLLRFPIDTDTRAVLLRLAGKYKVDPPEQIEAGGL